MSRGAVGGAVGGGGPAATAGDRHDADHPPDDRGGVSVAVEGPVAIVSIDRRGKLNALSSWMELQLASAIESAEVRASRCVVLTGGPEVFSAGADLAEMKDLDAGGVFDYYRRSGGVYEQVAALPQPSVSAISGYCLGGGLELALATDFRIAGESAIFGFPEVGIGIVPSSGGIHRLVRAVGPVKAREVVLARPRFAATEALTLGLVTEVVPPADTLPRAIALARELSLLPSLAATLALRAIDAAAESSRDVALFVEQLAYAALAAGSVTGGAGQGSPAESTVPTKLAPLVSPREGTAL